jgi:hypothetical protein
MSGNRLVIEGIDELRRALRALPAELRGESAHIVEARANGAAVAVRANYGAHAYTGHLQESVVVEHTPTQFGAAAVVRARAPHAHLFEFGTATRRTVKGWNRGVMPAAPPIHAFIPVVMRERRAMYEDDFRALLERAGLVVTGHAD